jgi:hypothetical protein
MKRVVLILLLLSSLPVVCQDAPQNSKPKVRAITAFARLDGANFQKQVAETLVVLRRAESEFKSLGYEVQTVRITTQPVAELVAGLSEEQALEFLSHQRCAFSSACYQLCPISTPAPSLPTRRASTGSRFGDLQHL